MATEDDVKRAVGVINVAITNSMFPLGVMPEDDRSKLEEAQKLVLQCQQAAKVAEAIGHSRVKNWPGIRDILAEAGIDVDGGESTNGAATVVPTQPPVNQEAPTSTPSSPPAPTSSAPEMSGQPVTPVPASSASASSSPSSAVPTVSNGVAVSAVHPHPTSPDGILAEPQVNEIWSAVGAGRWLVLKHVSDGMIEALSQATNEVATIPLGMLKDKVTEAYIAVEVDPNWNLSAEKGYNTLWYTHAGCARWFVPLDDMQLPIVGQPDECNNCALVLPIMAVEPSGYVYSATAPAPVQVPSQVTPMAPTPPATKQPFITLTAYPDRGVKLYDHPGCSSWEAELANKPLLAPGVIGQCLNCGDQLELKTVEANGYDPATWTMPTTPPAQPPQPVQEVPPSAPSPSPSSPASSPAPQTSVPAATPAETPPTPSSTASRAAPAAPSSPSASTEQPTTGAPVEHDERDHEYARILDAVEADFLPAGMPAPQDLEEPPPAMPEDLTQNPEANRELHSKFNALAARARYLAKIEERIARDCGRAVRLRLRPHMSKAKKELGASSSLTERREWAEEIGGDDVRLWLERQQKHADRAEAYGEFFHIYSGNVATLSRDLSWAQNEERGA